MNGVVISGVEAKPHRAAARGACPDTAPQSEGKTRTHDGHGFVSK